MSSENIVDRFYAAKTLGDPTTANIVASFDPIEVAEYRGEVIKAAQAILCGGEARSPHSLAVQIASQFGMDPLIVKGFLLDALALNNIQFTRHYPRKLTAI